MPLSVAGLDKRIDPTRAPLPGAKAPVPATGPDPPDLRGMIGLPNGSADEITFYFSLPIDVYTLREAAKDVTTPGTGSYRHFFESYWDAGRTYGAKPSAIEAAVRSAEAKGLSVMVDPSRTFVRVWATAQQWKKALGRPLKVQNGTREARFAVYSFQSAPKFDQLTCASGSRLAGQLYAPSQIATAYDASAPRETAAAKAARVSVIDLGGGYLDSDIQQAARCFGYAAPRIGLQTGDGISGQIQNNNDETELDLQTLAGYLPGSTIHLIEATNGPTSMLDAISRTLGDAHGFPDAASISYAQCAVQESQNNLALIQAIARLVILGNIAGSSLFAAAGDWGSTTSGNTVTGTSQSFPASGTWLTSVGGTRLVLNSRNQRTSEVAWNDRAYGIIASSGGGVSKVFKRPFSKTASPPRRCRWFPTFPSSPTSSRDGPSC